MFTGNDVLEYIDVSSWDIGACDDVSSMFAFSYKINVDISAWDTTILFDVSNMFEDCTGQTIAVPDFWNTIDSGSWHDDFATGAVNIANYADIPDDWKGL